MRMRVSSDCSALLQCVPIQKLTRKSSYFSTEIESFIGYDCIVPMQGRRNVFSVGGGGGKDKKGHCNVKKGTNGVHADNNH